MPISRLEVVPDGDEDAQQGRAVAGLTLALRALSQRALVALADLFTLLTVGSAFWLWMTIIQKPDAYQLVGLGMYACFVLAANWIVRR